MLFYLLLFFSFRHLWTWPLEACFRTSRYAIPHGWNQLTHPHSCQVECKHSSVSLNEPRWTVFNVVSLFNRSIHPWVWQANSGTKPAAPLLPRKAQGQNYIIFLFRPTWSNFTMEEFYQLNEPPLTPAVWGLRGQEEVPAELLKSWR